MSTNREQLKVELSEAIQKGKLAKSMLQLQYDTITKIKNGIVEEITKLSMKKTTVKFLFFTLTKREDIDKLDKLKAELSVIVSYEKQLLQLVNNGDIAGLNLKSLL